jgi:hypothetical protein
VAKFIKKTPPNYVVFGGAAAAGAAAAVPVAIAGAAGAAMDYGVRLMTGKGASEIAVIARTKELAQLRDGKNRSANLNRDRQGIYTGNTMGAILEDKWNSLYAQAQAIGKQMQSPTKNADRDRQGGDFSQGAGQLKAALTGGVTDIRAAGTEAGNNVAVGGTNAGSTIASSMIGAASQVASIIAAAISGAAVSVSVNAGGGRGPPRPDTGSHTLIGSPAQRGF